MTRSFDFADFLNIDKNSVIEPAETPSDIENVKNAKATTMTAMKFPARTTAV
ncbi:MAG: hypothetical protein IJR98_05745 [Synergistaceae bacterium]|nr:hypothetical protein [Synergistaceae bacterium]